MNWQWRDPRVLDILMKAGLKVENGHVAFACLQEPCQDDDWYGGSIELWRVMALDREVTLALEVQVWTQPYLYRAGLLVDEL
jgi:sulfite oxidase